MKTFKQILIYITGLLLTATGLIFAMRSGIGMSLILALSYTMSLITKTEFASWCFIFFALMICCQPLLKMKASKNMLLTQIVTALLLSVFVGVLNRVFKVIHPYDQYTVCLTYALFSLFFTALGLAHLKLSGLVNKMLPEDFMAALAQKKRTSVFNVKTVIYITLVVMSVILSLMFSGRLESIREATLIYLIGMPNLTAYFYKMFEKAIDAFVNKTDIDSEKAETVFRPTAVEAFNEADVSDIIKSIDVSEIKNPGEVE